MNWHAIGNSPSYGVVTAIPCWFAAGRLHSEPNASADCRGNKANMNRVKCGETSVIYDTITHITLWPTKVYGLSEPLMMLTHNNDVTSDWVYQGKSTSQSLWIAELTPTIETTDLSSNHRIYRGCEQEQRSTTNVVPCGIMSNHIANNYHQSYGNHCPIIIPLAQSWLQMIVGKPNSEAMRRSWGWENDDSAPGCGTGVQRFQMVLTQ